MKRIRLVLLILGLLVISSVCSYAASTTETECADALHEIGLFSGTGTNADGSPIYSLDKQPTRAEAITMLVRLLGKEEEAKATEWETPFTDVEKWAQPYVGYAYNNGLSNGTSATTFGSYETASEAQYITFVLRALGYNDKEGDFKWDNAKELSNKLNITYGDIDQYFYRGDLVEISYFALKTNLKDSNVSLLKSLYNNGAVKTSVLPGSVSGPTKPTLQKDRIDPSVPFSFTYCGDGTDCEYYLIKIDDSYTASEENAFQVYYGDNDKTMQSALSSVYSLAEMKKGITVSLSYYIISLHKEAKADDYGVMSIVQIDAVPKVVGKTATITSTFYNEKAKKSPVAFKSNVDGEIYDKLAVAYGMFDGLELIEYPETDGEYINNFMYLFMRGEWEYDKSSFYPADADWVFYDFEIFKTSFLCYLDTISYPLSVYAKDGKFYVLTKTNNPIFTPQEIVNRQIEVYEEALVIKNEIRKAGLITDRSTDLEKAIAYSKFLYTYIYGNNKRETPTAVNSNGTLYLMEYTGPYTIFFHKMGLCAPHEAAYSLMMHMEGIACYGLHVASKGEHITGSHFVSYFVAEGKEYICDWGNGYGVLPVDEMDPGLFYAEDLEYLLPRLLIQNNGNIINSINQYELQFLTLRTPYTVTFVKRLFSNGYWFEQYRISTERGDFDSGLMISVYILDPVTRNFIGVNGQFEDEYYDDGYNCNILDIRFQACGIKYGEGVIMLRPSWGKTKYN